MGRAPQIDRKEIEDLYKRYGALVRRRARGLLGDDSEAQDAMQEVFVRVIAAMAEFRGQSQPSTWLYRITTNLCLNRIRDGKRRRERLAEVARGQEGAPLSGNIQIPVEARVTLRGVLAQVPDELAQVAIYYFVDEMDQSEIATLIGVSRRTIGYRLDRFRERALELLGDRAVALGPLPGVSKGEGGTG